MPDIVTGSVERLLYRQTSSIGHILELADKQEQPCFMTCSVADPGFLKGEGWVG